MKNTDLDVIDLMVLAGLIEKVKQAKAKHADFPKTASPGFSIISEEFLELNEAMLHLCRKVNENYPEEHLIEEAYHVAVTAIRFIEQRKK